jgi:hypothetical protein
MLFSFGFLGGGAANTARTQAFLTATGITDQTIIDALNAMDTSLISAGLLPSGTGAGKIKALYPIVGGTATTHKFNFVIPLDTNAAYRLAFFGGFTHDSHGMQGNGTNNYVNTFFNPSIDADLNDLSVFGYSRTDNDPFEIYDLGCYDSTTTPPNMLATIKFNDSGNTYAGLNSNSFITPVNTDSSGFFAASRIDSANITLNIRGTNTTTANTSQIRPNLNIYLTALNFDNSRFASSNRVYSTFGMGSGLTTSELIDLNSIITTFNS